MKKSILSIAVLFASMTAFSAAAQTPTNTTSNCKAKTECGKPCPNKDAAKYNPFAGLNLTDKQKADLQALKPNKETVAKAKTEAKAEKQAQRKQMAEKRIQNRRDYLAKVKNILTPEQYVQFLENSYVDQAFKGPQHGKMAKGKDGRHHHGGKAKDRAQR